MATSVRPAFNGERPFPLPGLVRGARAVLRSGHVSDRAEIEIVNCHIHTFTHEHAPDRFVRPPLNVLLRIGWFRRWLLNVVRAFDRGRRGRIARYAEILEIAQRSQEAVFEIARGFYPEGTRFVVLPMDMTWMGAGRVRSSIDEQHAELARLRDSHPEVLPFAAVDPRHPGIVEKTVELLERQRFRGIKLYPPIGYHPNDRELWPLYAYAEEHGIPVLAHCSRPAGVQYRGEPTDRMRTDPVSGERLDLDTYRLLSLFTDPDTYRPILQKHPRLRICLAHFGGAEDWGRFLSRPWGLGGAAVDRKGMLEKLADRLLPGDDPRGRSWLAKIAGMLRSGDYPGLWTDIAYTVFADEEYLYLLKVLLADPQIRARVLFGSDFYVVADARLEERRRSIRIRAVLGEEVFRAIAQDNPRIFLGL